MAQVHSKMIGGSLVYWTEHRHRIVGVIGGDAEFLDINMLGVGVDTVDSAFGTTTVVEAGSGTSELSFNDTIERGSVKITTAANENDGLNFQHGGERALLDSGNFVYFRMKARINDVTQTDFFCGLAVRDGSVLTAITDRLGFESLDGSTSVGFVAEKDGTQTKTSDLLTIADDTDFDLEFVWDGTNLYEYVNGAAASSATATTNLPNDELLLPTVEFLTGEATANNMIISKFTFASISLD